MKRFELILSLLLIPGLCFLVGCEKDAATTPEYPDTPGELINLGWSEFENGHLLYAAEIFDDALDIAEINYWTAYGDSLEAAQIGDIPARDEATMRMADAIDDLIESANGLGWCVVALDAAGDGANLFQIVMDLDPYHPDALAGYAITLQIMEEWHQSNEKVATLVDTTWVLDDSTGLLEPVVVDPTWIFEHGDVDYLDLRLLRAENYFFLADYELSLQEALALNEIVGYVQGLSEEDFNLATIEGRTALLNLIDALDNLI